MLSRGVNKNQNKTKRYAYKPWAYYRGYNECTLGHDRVRLGMAGRCEPQPQHSKCPEISRDPVCYFRRRNFLGECFWWRHNERDGVSSHLRLDCLLNRLFKRRWKKSSKFRVTDLCARISPVTGEMASNAENVFIWWYERLTVCCETWTLFNLLFWGFTGIDGTVKNTYTQPIALIISMYYAWDNQLARVESKSTQASDKGTAFLWFLLLTEINFNTSMDK